MNCNRVNEIEIRNLYKKISPQERAELILHCETCSNCEHIYNEYISVQNKIEGIPQAGEPAFIKEKVLANIEKEESKKSLFDFIFGVGHNPYKAGFAVGLGVLVLVVLGANVLSLNKKPANYENFYASNANTTYTSQFYNK